MKSLFSSFLIFILFSSTLVAQNPKPEKLTYPESKKVDSSNNYFGTVVPDPYRWLENDQATDTKAWVVEQNKVSKTYLESIPFRDSIYKRLEKLWNYEKYSAPFKEGRYTYYYKNNGLQSQSVLYRQIREGASEVFLDPNVFSMDGTTSLGGIDFSKDGSLAAYLISEGGSDWRKVIVLRTLDKKILEDTLTDVKFSGIAWKGNDGFYYSSYDRPKVGSNLTGMTQHHKLYYHKLGTPQHSDPLIFGGEVTPRRYIGAYLTEDERFLVISAAESTTGNELYFQDLKNVNSPIKQLVKNFKMQVSILTSLGSTLYIFTNHHAPKFKIVTVSSEDPKPENWKDLIPETDNVLEASTGGGKIFAQYLKDATSFILQYSMKGILDHRIELPSVGTASGFETKKEEKETYYTFTSYIFAPTIFKYSIVSGQSQVYKKSGVSFNPENYISKQIFYPSRDGTEIPMTITYRKGIVMDGRNPTYLYAYGGFGISLTPAFNPSDIILLESGGILAVPNLRGGGEYGEKWHLAGIKLQKQNVFDDFIAAAEYLVHKKYTSKEYLAISGASNGGLLIGAILSQRPDLCSVAFPAVGVMDMLRYNKFTAGAGWAYDYGTAEESKTMFDYLYHYSPYHALKPAIYPATLVTTSDHDDRVVPAHSFKFVARLQEDQKGPFPVIISIETKAGHGAGKSTSQIINEEADKWAFMFYNMGINPNLKK